MIDGADRPLAPLGSRGVSVGAITTIGPYTMFDVADALGPVPRAGQFYMLSTAAGWSGGEDGRPFLPRAFSFARAAAEDGGVRLSFFLEDVGPGTHVLSRVMPGDELRITGPFGNGFELAGGDAILAGGGIGVAPLLALFDELLAAGRGDFRVLLGFRSAQHAAAAELFDGSATVATDDGSAGHHGFVTELLAPRVAQGGTPVYACGPPPMLEAVRALCADNETPVQLALESGMACGFGACYGCVVPTRHGYMRLCVDGPVLEGDDIESALVGGH